MDEDGRFFRGLLCSSVFVFAPYPHVFDVVFFLLLARLLPPAPGLSPQVPASFAKLYKKQMCILHICEYVVKRVIVQVWLMRPQVF